MKEYLKLLQTSAVLLLVTAPVHNLFIPGKLIDYLGACRPILAFVPRDSEATAILRFANVKTYCSSDVDVLEGVQALKKIWKAFCDKELSASTPDDVAKWSSRTLAAKFVGRIESILIR